MRGIVTAVEDRGSIVTMHVEDREGAVEDVYFDRRMFFNLCAAEYPNALGPQYYYMLTVGREVEVRGDFGEQVVEFDPDPEYADAEPDQVASWRML